VSQFFQIHPELATIDDWRIHMLTFILAGMGLIFVTCGAAFLIAIRYQRRQVPLQPASGQHLSDFYQSSGFS